MTKGIIDKVLNNRNEIIEKTNELTPIDKIRLIAFSHSIKEELENEIKVYLMDRERYNTGLYRFLFGDNE